MKNLVALIFFCTIGLVVSDSPNIPVTSVIGPAYVNAEELLEAALGNALVEYGVTDVDVDERDRDRSTFRVELYSRDVLGNDFQTTLSNVLQNDLGFTGVEIREQPVGAGFRSRFFGNKSVYYLLFNPATMIQEMQKVAQEVMKTTYLELEDSPFD